jgi:hypothetical protein
MDRHAWSNLLVRGAALIALMVTLTGCGGGGQDYRHDADTEVITFDSRTVAGPPADNETCNHIPNLRVWGDGRVVIVDSGSNRLVRAGTLDDSQMQAVIKLLDGHGILKQTTPLPANPAGTGYALTVQLNSGTYTQGWYSRPALLDELRSAINPSRLREYVPEKGLLVTGSFTLWTPPVALMTEWPTSTYGFSLSEATQGKWVSGDALQFLWKTINTNNPAGLREGNRVWGIGLEIPGISIQDPPFDCWVRTK